MTVVKRFFPDIIPDNEDMYISQTCGLIESLDEFCDVQISKFPSCYHFRLAPSLPKYTSVLLEHLFVFNNKLGIKLDLSKSIKTSAVIAYQINI